MEANTKANPFWDQELKEQLHEGMRRPGGIYQVLTLLQELATELAEDQREIVGNLVKARAWDQVARHMRLAKGKCLPLSQLSR
jgi:hypothetical protein